LRFRSDAPASLTGTYGIRFTSPGIDGFVLLGMRLEDVSRTATTATAQGRSSGAQGVVQTRVARMRQMIR
jgi:hypothetical protein